MQRLAAELESEMIIELLSSEEGGLWPARVALRGQLERLKRVAQRCIDILPAVGDERDELVDSDEPIVVQGTYRIVANPVT